MYTLLSSHCSKDLVKVKVIRGGGWDEAGQTMGSAFNQTIAASLLMPYLCSLKYI